MIFVKILSILVLLVIISVVIFMQLNNKSKATDSVVKRISIEDISILQLPKQEKANFMEALVNGKLIVKDNCLKLAAMDFDKVYTLVLPSHFQLHIENEALVVKYQDKVVGQEGQNVELSGGEASDISHLGIAHQQCNHPPFWIAGDEMRFLK